MGLTDRFKDLEWFPQEDTFCIVGGAGGISSWLALLLARAGFTPVIYDFDTIEEHNIGGQFFPVRSIGQAKVSAIAQSILEYTGKYIQAINGKYVDTSEAHAYMFSGFDNMEARRVMFMRWKQFVNTVNASAKHTCIFIDGRLQAERFQIFCITGDNLVAMENYEKNHLFKDEDVEDAPCTMKQTSHTAAMIAAYMVSFFTNFLSNKATGIPMRSVPFYYELFLPLTLQTIEI